VSAKLKMGKGRHPVAGGGGADDTTTGLVARWPLDDGSGTTLRETVASRVGTLTSSTLWSAGELVFNELDYATVPYNSVWDITPDITIILWTRTDVRAADRTLFSRYNFSTNLRSWEINILAASPSVMNVRISSDGGALSGTGKDYTGSQLVADNTGTMRSMAFRLQAGVLDLFVQGVRDTATIPNVNNPMSQIKTSNIGLGIGALTDTSGVINPSFGAIRNIRLFNIAKSNIGVANLHALGPNA
jgi:hypothetical protein